MRKYILVVWFAAICCGHSQDANQIIISQGALWSVYVYSNGSARLSLGAEQDAYVKAGEFDFRSILGELKKNITDSATDETLAYKVTIRKGDSVINANSKHLKDLDYVSALFREIAAKCRVRAESDLNIFNDAVAYKTYPPFGLRGIRLKDSQIGGSPLDMFTADDIAKLPESSTIRMSWEWKYGAVESVPNENIDKIENNEIDVKSMNAVNESDEKSSDAADRQSTVNKLPATDAGGSAGYLFFALTCISILALLAVLIFRKNLRKK